MATTNVQADAKFGPGWGRALLGVGTGSNAKWHYYSAGFAGRSLCGKYTMLGGERQDDNHESPDNCTQCARRYYAQHPELELPRRWRRVRVEVTEDVKHPEFDYVYLRAGTRGYVHGVTDDSLRRLASQGAKTLFESVRPKRSVLVRADNLRALP